MRPWLAIVGIGEDGLAGLSAAALAQVEAAEVLAGGERHLAMVPADGRERVAWTAPLDAMIERILSLRGRRVCLLASGDPMDHGAGATLLRRVPAEEALVVPAPGAFALACARLGWPRAEVATLSVHGRPLALLHPWVQPGARLLVLCGDGTTPRRAAALLRDRGFGPSRMAVLERMGGPAERRREGTAETWEADEGDEPCAGLSTLAVECRPGPGARRLARVPGLPDGAFRHDGQITKRETRAATLAALAPAPGQLLWDVGAGCGSVAVEWMRTHPLCRAVAIEPRAERRAMIAENAEALGCPGIEVVPGRAPEALAGLPRPDAVFVGGGAGAPGVLESCWDALPPGGRLVANAVTLEGERALLDFQAGRGGELSRISVCRAEPVGGFLGWRPLMPVTQLCSVKE